MAAFHPLPTFSADVSSGSDTRERRVGKFRKAPARVTFPIAVMLHFGLLFFATVLGVAALLQPVFLILGRVEEGAGQASLNFAMLAAGAVGLIGVDRLIQKIALWLQP